MLPEWVLCKYPRILYPPQVDIIETCISLITTGNAYVRYHESQSIVMDSSIPLQAAEGNRDTADLFAR